jgi:hypothetical protein
MIFNLHPFEINNVSVSYKASIHFKKWFKKWEIACSVIEKLTSRWQLHWERKKTLATEKLLIIEQKLNLLFKMRDKFEEMIREEKLAF